MARRSIGGKEKTEVWKNEGGGGGGGEGRSEHGRLTFSRQKKGKERTAKLGQ